MVFGFNRYFEDLYPHDSLKDRLLERLAPICDDEFAYFALCTGGKRP